MYRKVFLEPSLLQGEVVSFLLLYSRRSRIEDIAHPPPPAAQKLLIPSAAHLVTTGTDRWTETCKLPRSSNRAWSKAAA